MLNRTHSKEEIQKQQVSKYEKSLGGGLICPVKEDIGISKKNSVEYDGRDI